MEPLLICETFVSRFKFWLDGQIHDGMQHRNELFRCLRKETVLGRQQVYDLSWALSHEGVHTVVTASKGHYTLWVSLRSLANLEGALDLSNPKLLTSQILSSGVRA
ncbi:hypothetical protein [Leptolyngbya sp. FACHB-16]|uniref:hypothetical protein n=1 Tax=unclassified Leptolyngbya TaxID=2650499 RepID=UPI0016837A77|nr:hypothetical protein [Leptolyngbya sp. FACHB-16]MBD2155627.1 hypothetical protein [Leptolyngbya sp. FACHB-16]